MIELTVTLTGTSPLLSHNAQAADPLTWYAKELAVLDKVPKKDRDVVVWSNSRTNLEIRSSLYIDPTDPSLGPCLPALNIMASFKAGGSKTDLKNGKNKVVTAVYLSRAFVPIEYEGPRDADSLVADLNYQYRTLVKIGQSRVPHTRPRFDPWWLRVALHLDTDILSVATFTQFITAAGVFVGIGDYRPQRGGTFGKYSVEVKEA